MIKHCNGIRSQKLYSSLAVFCFVADEISPQTDIRGIRRRTNERIVRIDTIHA